MSIHLLMGTRVVSTTGSLWMLLLGTWGVQVPVSQLFFFSLCAELERTRTGHDPPSPGCLLHRRRNTGLLGEVELAFPPQTLSTPAEPWRRSLHPWGATYFGPGTRRVLTGVSVAGGSGWSRLPFLSSLDRLPGAAPALPTLPASSLPHSPLSPSNRARPPASCSLRSRDAAPGACSPASPPATGLAPGSPAGGKRAAGERPEEPLCGPAASSVAQTLRPSGPSASLTNCLIFFGSC